MIVLYADKPNPPGLWLQLGITHPEATARAEAAGIPVVADRCLMVESRNAGIRLSELVEESAREQKESFSG
jgi:predicted CoA-binding protein